jgi:hypothetical protein
MVWENVVILYPAGNSFHRKVIVTHFPKYSFSCDRDFGTVKDRCLRVDSKVEVK